MVAAVQEVSAGRQAVDDAGLDTPSAELLEFLSRTAGVKPKSAVHKPDARAGTDQAAESAHPEVRSPRERRSQTVQHGSLGVVRPAKPGVACFTRNGHHPRQLRSRSNVPP